MIVMPLVDTHGMCRPVWRRHASPRMAHAC
jgi:hypothetical protein